MSGGAFGSPAALARLRKRRAAERRFRRYGQAAIGFSILALGWLLVSIIALGLPAFHHHAVTLSVPASTATTIDTPSMIVDPRDRLARGLAHALGEVEVDARRRADMLDLISTSAAVADVRKQDDASPVFLIRVPVSDRVDSYLKHGTSGALSDRQIAWLDQWRAEGRLRRQFNANLLSNPDSRDTERAGLATAMLGSLMILIIASGLALPVGIGAAIYLDSFAPRTGWGGWATRALEVNLNNLAAVPPILFGLLGLAVFINLFGLSRSIPLVGGLVLALRMFPTVVIATRGALASVPSRIMDGALSLGASRMQAVFGHKVRVAAPGILTGSIIGMAQALGETAPLLMIGMVAFVTRVPEGPLDPASAMPVQIYLWSGASGEAWLERASAGIILLLIVLLLINAVAIVLRERLQRRRYSS